MLFLCSGRQAVGFLPPTSGAHFLAHGLRGGLQNQQTHRFQGLQHEARKKWRLLGDLADGFVSKSATGYYIHIYITTRIMGDVHWIQRDIKLAKLIFQIMTMFMGNMMIKQRINRFGAG